MLKASFSHRQDQIVQITSVIHSSPPVNDLDALDDNVQWTVLYSIWSSGVVEYKMKESDRERQ